MSNCKLPVFGIERHRLHTDGIGVTTLVGTYGCPLKCKYCINPHAWNPKTLENVKYYSPQELYDVLKKDNLYFLATGGGVVFGGGEPLLHSAFIREFRDVCGTEWRLTLETSLNVDEKLLVEVLEVVDDFIVDIKDVNPNIYKCYTGRENRRVLENLKLLLESRLSSNICVRVPRIPKFNTEEDTDATISYLKLIGVEIIEEFTYIVGDGIC